MILFHRIKGRYSTKAKEILFMAISLVFLLLVNICGYVGCSISNIQRGENQDAIKPGEFIIEPPTLLCLGFEWYVEGDENHNAVVEVSCRKKGHLA
jgi:hypothetical protein